MSDGLKARPAQPVDLSPLPCGGTEPPLPPQPLDRDSSSDGGTGPPPPLQPLDQDHSSDGGIEPPLPPKPLDPELQVFDPPNLRRKRRKEGLDDELSTYFRPSHSKRFRKVNRSRFTNTCK